VNRSLVTVSMAAVLFAGAIGCGGGNNDKSNGSSATNGGATTGAEPSTGGGTKTTGGTSKAKGKSGKSRPPNTVTLELRDAELRPANVKVRVGTVVFKVENKGLLLHALVIKGPRGTTRSKPLVQEHSQTLRVSFDKPGKYKWYCPIDSHRKVGEKGTITVK
jgi:plastocyanin